MKHRHRIGVEFLAHDVVELDLPPDRTVCVQDTTTMQDIMFCNRIRMMGVFIQGESTGICYLTGEKYADLQTWRIQRRTPCSS